MIIDQELMRLLYNKLVDLGHPDPIAALARTKLETNFDENYLNDKGRVGFVAIDPDLAKSYGFDNVSDVEIALEAMTAIDSSNYTALDNNIDKMLVAWRKNRSVASRRKKPLQSDRRWLRRVKGARKEIAKMVGVVHEASEIKAEAAADKEMAAAVNGQAFTIEKKPEQTDILNLYFPDVEVTDIPDVAQVQNGEKVDVEIDSYERMVAMLVTVLETL